MSDKSFGDHLNRNIVKNPLLSTAVTGLSIEDLTHNAVLLPVAPSQELNTRQDQPSGPQSATLAQPYRKNDNFRPGDTNSNTLHTNYPPTNKINYYDNEQNIKNVLDKPMTHSKASTKSDDDFDVNEYFARLQGTRYVSAPLNSVLKEDQKATLEATEDNLEEINLNEPEKAQNVEVQQSLTSDIAQNFSQLPTVLPQVASAVFSSFSNMLSMKSREHTPDEPAPKPSGYQDVQFQMPDNNDVPLMSDEQIAPREMAPPPTQPPISGTTNYRITTKKKTYAQIPGLSSTHQSTNPPTNTTTPYYNPDFSSSLIPQQQPPISIMGIQNDEIKTESHKMPAQTQEFHIFNSIPLGDNTQAVSVTIGREYDVFNTLEADKSLPHTPETNKPELNIQTKDSNSFKTVESHEQSGSQIMITNTAIIPPPPMFSNRTKKSQSNVQSVLPPSVARRIGSNNVVVKPQTLLTPAPIDNIFIPAPVADVLNETDFGASNIPFPLDLTLPVKDDKPPMGSQSAFVQFNAPTTTMEKSFPPTVPPGTTITNMPLDIPSCAISSSINISPVNPVKYIPHPDIKLSSNISSVINQTVPFSNLTASKDLPPTDTAPPPMFFNPSSMPLVPDLKYPEVEALQSIPIVSYTPTNAPQIPTSTLYSTTQQVIEPKINLQSITSNISNQNISHSMADALKPLPEPPKLSGNLSYRMTKKKPQYYSGPIEGVGAISNNIKPTVSTFEPSTFQGALFTPDTQTTCENPTNTNAGTVFDINQHTVTPPAPPTLPPYPQFDINPPQTQNYAPTEYDTAFDMSRQSTDSNFEAPKQESKGFGIIGSLKSKLSSLDINKIQNSVTTFFDPTYNDTKKEPSEGNVGYNAFNYQDGSLEVFVPSAEQISQTYSHNYDQNNHQNPYNYGQSNQYYQNQSYDYGKSAYDSQSLYSNYAHNPLTQNYDPSSMQAAYSTSYFSEQVSSAQASTESTANNNVPGSVTGIIPTNAIETTSLTREQKAEVNKPQLLQAREKSNETVSTTTNERVSSFVDSLISQPIEEKAFQPAQILTQEHLVSHKNEIDNINLHPAELKDTPEVDFFGIQKSYGLSERIYTEELNKKLENLQITHETKEDSLPDNNTIYEKIKTEIFSKDSDVSTPIDLQLETRLGNDFFGNLTPQHTIINNDFQSPLGTKGVQGVDKFDINDSIIGNCCLDSFGNKVIMDDVPRLDAPTILFGLPSLPATNTISELDNYKKNDVLYETPQNSGIRSDGVDFFDNIIEENKPLTEKCDSTSELNICETCREFSKHDEREVDDLTTQLIENITSPIQLLNPVIAPLTECISPVEDRTDFDSEQCAEITHITEETIETIQVQSATELLDDVDELSNPNIMNYGWATEAPPYLKSDSLVDHNYSFEIDPTAIGFYGNNSLFFEDVPNNASDEIKAEFKSSHEETPVSLPRQMSIPSAPPAEEEDDNKSDETGILDVQSIEQDAKKDFPFYEEFVIEPSETDDDKIEYRERERSSEDPVQDVDTFTNRVERFKQMEEYVDKPDDLFGSQNNLLFDLNDTSPAIPIASYFDTGNYAAETHYRNSISSPSMPFQVGSPNMSFSIPPGFEDEYKRKLNALVVQDDKKSDKDDDVPYIPDCSTQTRPVITTTYSSVSNISPNITVTSNIGFIPKLQEETHRTEITKPPEFSAVFSHKLESGDNLASSLFAKIEDKKPAVYHEPKVDNEPGQLQTLPDPISFFTAKEETPKVESSDSGFNRLASYFAAPAKNEHSKPFFELSQSQNHHRHVNLTTNFDSGVTTSNNNTCHNLNNQSETSSTLHNIPTDVYLANLKLMNDLTSSQNIAFTPNDQIVRTVNYFTIEYDNNVEVKSSLYETDLKKLDKQNLKQDRVEVDEEGASDDVNYVTVVTKCKFCCNNDYHRVITLNKVEVNTDFIVRKVMDAGGNDNNSGTKTDRKADMDQRQQDGRKEVTVDFGNPQEDESERVSIMSENRATAEYTPVKHHWFYRVDFEGKSIWRGFSAIDNKALEEAFLSPDLNENTVVATDGGRFDVNIVGRLRIPVYWSDKPTNVLRCSWFYKGTTDARYVPYTEQEAEKLEAEYRRGVVTGEWHRRLVLPSRELVVLHGPAVMVHLSNTPDALASQSQTTMRPRVVRRGCDETEIEDPEPSSIDHLLLLCHGVGSACDMRFRSVEEVVDDFRATSLQLVQSHYRNSCDNGVVNRVEVLPISWHGTLHSGETGVDKRLSAITLDSIPRLRNFTNDTVLDVLFYTSPVFCQTIIDTVCAELNRIYGIFMARNPGFTGQVSLGGHSLGSVILYDLLCHQHPENAPSYKSPNKIYVQGAAGTGQATVQYPPLDFMPAALYALGSPIAMFECIRGVKSLGTDFCLPTCKNFFNIFHPYDPIAYRIEPLINAHLGTFKPYLIPHHKGRKRMHLELKDTMARVGADLKQKLIESLKSTWTSMWKSQPPPNDGQLEKVVEEEMEKEQLCVEGKEDLSQTNDLATPEALGVLNAGRRVDYVLQEAPFEMINEYLFAMSSHVCYWESEDTMLLILREIYDSLGVRPDCTVPQQSMTVERTKNVNETVTVTPTDIPSTSRNGT